MKNNKIFQILVIVLSIAVICLASIQLLGIWENAICIFEPLIGTILLLQAVQLWNQNRKVAIFQLCGAVFILCVAVYILLFQTTFQFIANALIIIGSGSALGCRSLDYPQADRVHRLSDCFHSTTNEPTVTMYSGGENTLYIVHPSVGCFGSTPPSMG